MIWPQYLEAFASAPAPLLMWVDYEEHGLCRLLNTAAAKELILDAIVSRAFFTGQMTLSGWNPPIIDGTM
jgi:hypothetical protein